MPGVVAVSAKATAEAVDAFTRAAIHPQLAPPNSAKSTEEADVVSTRAALQV